MTGKACPVKLTIKGEEYSCFLWYSKELSTRGKGKSHIGRQHFHKYRWVQINEASLNQLKISLKIDCSKKVCKSFLLKAKEAQVLTAFEMVFGQFMKSRVSYGACSAGGAFSRAGKFFSSLL